jgi:hypothetical protein
MLRKGRRLQDTARLEDGMRLRESLVMQRGVDFMTGWKGRGRIMKTTANLM